MKTIDWLWRAGFVAYAFYSGRPIVFVALIVLDALERLENK